jgi:hypothetical protein
MLIYLFRRWGDYFVTWNIQFYYRRLILAPISRYCSTSKHETRVMKINLSSKKTGTDQEIKPFGELNYNLSASVKMYGYRGITWIQQLI